MRSYVEINAITCAKLENLENGEEFSDVSLGENGSDSETEIQDANIVERSQIKFLFLLIYIRFLFIWIQIRVIFLNKKTFK